MSDKDLVITVTLNWDEDGESVTSMVDYGKIGEFASRLPRDYDFSESGDRIYKLSMVATAAVSALVQAFCAETSLPSDKFMQLVTARFGETEPTKLKKKSDDLFH